MKISELLKEANPHDYDSDVDYYAALNKEKHNKPRITRQDPGQSDADLEHDLLQRRNKPSDVKQEWLDKDGVAPNGEDYNTVAIFSGTPKAAVEHEFKSAMEHHWGAKKVVDTRVMTAKMINGPTQITAYIVDNHKHGTWTPWKNKDDVTNEISDKALHRYRQAAHTQVQSHKFWGQKDSPDASKIIAKREKGMDQAGNKIVARRDTAQAQRAKQSRDTDQANKAQLEAELARLNREFDPNFQYSDDHSFWSAQNAIYKQINSLERRLSQLDETATAGATSSGNIASIANPHISPGSARGKKSYIGSPGKSGTKAPPQPKVVQPKNKNGTAKNGLDIKSASLFGGPTIKRR